MGILTSIHGKEPGDGIQLEQKDKFFSFFKVTYADCTCTPLYSLAPESAVNNPDMWRSWHKIVWNPLNSFFLTVTHHDSRNSHAFIPSGKSGFRLSAADSHAWQTTTSYSWPEHRNKSRKPWLSDISCARRVTEMGSADRSCSAPPLSSPLLVRRCVKHALQNWLID